MSSKSRRRTLSHLEVENFLNEISAKKITDNDIDISKTSNLKNINDAMNANAVKLETPPPPPDDAQLIRDYCKVLFHIDYRMIFSMKLNIIIRIY